MICVSLDQSCKEDNGCLSVNENSGLIFESEAVQFFWHTIAFSYSSIFTFLKKISWIFYKSPFTKFVNFLYKASMLLPESQIHWDQACQMLYTYVHGSQTIPSSEHISWNSRMHQNREHIIWIISHKLSHFLRILHNSSLL